MVKTTAASTATARDDGISPTRSHELDIKIGRRLKLRRQILRLTQEQLASELELSPQQIHKYEKGQCGLSSSRMVQIAHALEIPVSWFFDGIDDCDSLPESINSEVSDLIAAFSRITNPESRKKVLEITRILEDG